MKINRKSIPKKIIFGEISPATTFTLESRIAVYMKIDMSHFEFYCDSCDEENFLNNDFAINLETGDIEELDYRTPVTPINCELNEI